MDGAADIEALDGAGLPVECPWPAGWDELPSDGERLAGACQQSPGVGLMLGLAEIDVRGLSPDEAVTFAQQWDRAVSWAAGAQAEARAAVSAALVAAEEVEVARQAEILRQQNEERVAAGLKPRSNGFGFVPPEVAVQAELAAALRLSPRSVSTMVQFATDLAGPWRPMRAALLAGDVTENHAKAIGRVLTMLPAYLDPERAAEYEKHCAEVLAVVVPYARTHTPGQAAKKARDLITAIDPIGTQKRRQEAADREHGVFLNPREPGTSELMAVLPTETARAVYDAIRRLAGDARFEVADGCVTIGQRRVAALKTLVLGDPGPVERRVVVMRAGRRAVTTRRSTTVRRRQTPTTGAGRADQRGPGDRGRDPRPHRRLRLHIHHPPARHGQQRRDRGLRPQPIHRLRPAEARHQAAGRRLPRRRLHKARRGLRDRPRPLLQHRAC